MVAVWHYVVSLARVKDMGRNMGGKGLEREMKYKRYGKKRRAKAHIRGPCKPK